MKLWLKRGLFLLALLLTLSSSIADSGPYAETIEYTGDLIEGGVISFKVSDTYYNPIEQIEPSQLTLHFNEVVKTKDAKFSDRARKWLMNTAGQSIDPFEGFYLVGGVTITYETERVGPGCSGKECQFQVLVDPNKMNLVLRSGSLQNVGRPPFYPSSTLLKLPSQSSDEGTIIPEPFTIPPSDFMPYLLFYRSSDGGIARILSTTPKAVVMDTDRKMGDVSSFSLRFFNLEGGLSRPIARMTYVIEEVKDDDDGTAVTIRDRETGKRGTVHQSVSKLIDFLYTPNKKDIEDLLIFKKIGDSYFAKTAFPSLSLRVSSSPCGNENEKIEFCTGDNTCFTPYDFSLVLSEGFLKVYVEVDGQKQLLKVQRVKISSENDEASQRWNADVCSGEIPTDGGESAEQSRTTLRGSIANNCDNDDCRVTFKIDSLPEQSMNPLCLFGFAKTSQIDDLGSPDYWLERYTVNCESLTKGFTLSLPEGGLFAYLFSVKANFLSQTQEPLSNMHTYFYMSDLEELKLLAKAVLPSLSNSESALDEEGASDEEDGVVGLSPVASSNEVAVERGENGLHVTSPTTELLIDGEMVVKDETDHPHIELSEGSEITLWSKNDETKDDGTNDDEMENDKMKISVNDEATLVVTDKTTALEGGFVMSSNDIKSVMNDGVYVKDGTSSRIEKPLVQQRGKELSFERIDDGGAKLTRKTSGGVEHFKGSGSLTTNEGDEVITAKELGSLLLDIIRSIPLSKKREAQVTIKNGRVKAKAIPKTSDIEATEPRSYWYDPQNKHPRLISSANAPPANVAAITLQSSPHALRIVSNKHKNRPEEKSAPSRLSWREQLRNALGPSWNEERCPIDKIRESWYTYAQAARQRYKELTYNKEPLPLSLIFGVMCQESGLGQNLGPSKTGARGLMQIVPTSAGIDVLDPNQGVNVLKVLHDEYGRTDLPKSSCEDIHNCQFATSNQYKSLLLNDAQVNIFTGVAYLSWIHGQNSVKGDIEKVLHAYNAGIGNLERGKSCSFSETREYVRMICHVDGVNICFPGRSGGFCCQRNAYWC